MLRHDDARTVTKSKLDDSTHRLVADVWLQLNRMSPNKGKRTHRYTKDQGALARSVAHRVQIQGLVRPDHVWTNPLFN